MTYIPGDNWCICDLTGKKVLMSQTRKTWDGLRVWKDVWSPKHPQLSLKAIPDRMAVIDGRPRPADIFAVPTHGWGSFCLISPNRTNWIVSVADDGAMLVTAGTWGTPLSVFYVDRYGFTVDNDGALHVANIGTAKGPASWRINSTNRIGFTITVDTDLAVLVTVIAMPTFMAGTAARDGVFSLISPNGTSYVVYITDGGTLAIVAGSWGPSSTNFYLGQYVMTVADDGTVTVSLSGEQHQPAYRLVSPGGYEYMLSVNSSGVVVAGREGHWWDVASLVYDKVQSPYLETPVPYTIAEDGQNVWVAE